jgi:hypothetical protein
MPHVTPRYGSRSRIGRTAAIPHGWADPRPDRLAAPLGDFVGNPAYVGHLRGDLGRFVFLLGGGDGESPFGPAPQ